MQELGTNIIARADIHWICGVLVPFLLHRFNVDLNPARVVVERFDVITEDAVT